MPILIIAVIFNGFASSTMFTTYQTYVRTHASKGHSCAAFGLFFSSFNIAFVIGALISSVLIKHVHLPYLFLFIVVFSIISLISDQKLPGLNPKRFKELFSKETFLHQFFREVFSFSAFKHVFTAMK
ncbi:MFS transporter [Patescibacteria group bacterium]|nr:MFS transporter [Patescibacteria group bacterium]MBU1759089.1 MFS transporter [Patescibacteria group bacterium]